MLQIVKNILATPSSITSLTETRALLIASSVKAARHIARSKSLKRLQRTILEARELGKGRASSNSADIGIVGNLQALPRSGASVGAEACLQSTIVLTLVNARSIGRARFRDVALTKIISTDNRRLIIAKGICVADTVVPIAATLILAIRSREKVEALILKWAALRLAPLAVGILLNASRLESITRIFGSRSSTVLLRATREVAVDNL